MKIGSTANARPMVKYPIKVKATNPVIVERTFDDELRALASDDITL